MLAAISRVKTNRKIQPRVHVMRPAGTKRSTARMTKVTIRRLIVERHCTALSPLGLRAVLIRPKATQNPRSKERSRDRQDWKNKLSVRELWPFEFALVFPSCCPKRR